METITQYQEHANNIDADVLSTPEAEEWVEAQEVKEDKVIYWHSFEWMTKYGPLAEWFKALFS